MAKTLAKIQAQIAKLEQEAKALRDKEVAGVVIRIREAIAHYDLTVDELFGTKGRKVTGKRRSGALGKGPTKKNQGRKGVPAPVKFRDDQGNTWAGRGKRPRWLVAALDAGRKLEDFAV
jgi:DNA-binding protein H-NS